MQGLEEVWKVVPIQGSSWDILSENGYVIACDIPFGAYADHIVELHNAFLKVHNRLNGANAVPTTDPKIPNSLPDVKMDLNL